MSSTRRKKSSQADGYVGILAVDIHFPENGSLKDKRQLLRSLKARLARQLGASVAEVGFHDLWQRSRLVLSVCSPSFPEISRALDQAEHLIISRGLELAGVEREVVKMPDRGY